MKTSLRIAASLALLAGSTQVFADPMPNGARVPAPSQITQAYVGRTDLWKSDCGGGIYYGPGAKARAWCQNDPSGFGAGTWTVDQAGRLCQNLSWYWSSNGSQGSSAGETACINHVVDRFGKIWRNWPGSADWWPLATSEDFVRGYRFQNNVLSAQRGMGL